MTDTVTPAAIPDEHKDAMLAFFTTEHARVSSALTNTEETMEQLLIKTVDADLRRLADQKHRLEGAVGYLEAMIGFHQAAPAPTPEAAPPETPAPTTTT